MRKIHVLSLLLVSTFILTTTVRVQDDGTSTEPLVMSRSTLASRFTWHLNGGYVAAGVAMRNLGNGTITISGIPEAAHIKAAFLYWDILANEEGPTFNQGLFNDDSITGTLLGAGTDPCWGQAKNFAYKADVTEHVSGDGSYTLDGFASGLTDGTDPWPLGALYPPLCEGASLVIIYENLSSPYVSVTINDAEPVNNAISLWPPPGNLVDTTTFSGFNALGGGAQITFIIADGQDDSEPATYFNGNSLGISLWDGSDPKAGGGTYSKGNLWDTKTFDVSAYVASGDTTATATVTGEDQDCLVWVAAVFSVVERSVPPPISVFSNAVLMLPIAIIVGISIVQRRRKPPK